MPSSYRVHPSWNPAVVRPGGRIAVGEERAMAGVFGGPPAPPVGRFVPDTTDPVVQSGDAVAAAAVRG